MAFMDKIENKIAQFGHVVPGFVPGKAISIMIENCETRIDITTPPGKASGIEKGLLFTLRDDGYETERIEESIEVSPVHAQYYALTIKQKEELEGRIKTALASLSSAISELELLEHDLRKYKEFLQYFEWIEKGKKEKNEELVRKADQTLKSIFIDQVDVHTGEGVALKLITQRWPTVIVDFMKLSDEDVDIDKIAKKFGISPAEATILATKNKLYLEWREIFKETVQNRYERIRSLAEAKKKSIEEIKNSIKPVLLRYKSIKEIGESEEGRRELQRLSWLRPAREAVSIDISKIWAWKTFLPYGAGRITTEWRKEKKPIMRMRKIPREFKEWLRANLGAEAYKLDGYVPPFNAEPLDRIALYLIKELENFYKIKFTPKEILETRDKLIEDAMEKNVRSIYFVVNEIEEARSVIKLPDGSELEDLTFHIKTKIESYNITLVRYLEMKAKDKVLENYIDELLGEMSKGRKLSEIIKEEFPSLKGMAKKEKELKIEPLTSFDRIQKIFPIIRTGPYETNFQDRFTKYYLAEGAVRCFVPYVSYLKKSVGVP